MDGYLGVIQTPVIKARRFIIHGFNAPEGLGVIQTL